MENDERRKQESDNDLKTMQSASTALHLNLRILEGLVGDPPKPLVLCALMVRESFLPGLSTDQQVARIKMFVRAHKVAAKYLSLGNPRPAIRLLWSLGGAKNPVGKFFRALKHEEFRLTSKRLSAVYKHQIEAA